MTCVLTNWLVRGGRGSCLKPRGLLCYAETLATCGAAVNCHRLRPFAVRVVAAFPAHRLISFRDLDFAAEAPDRCI